MIIAERYEVQDKIGAGGMSDVYRGFDHKLNRNVAIKVLKQEFSENADFISKFRVEAQAAAGLMHQNIVNVYDVGEENGSHYIVMELVEGITLKKYIEKKARLSVKEATSIAIQVAMGIESAHNNHIIHRDIKPQNIIISKEGKVKVTDFGIAKAATSNTITSNVMGSVHYTSPEQVRGGFSDEKSDIYSLGITLFEMVTGRVPFNGETTVAVAIKHIQEPMPSPRDYVPEIPFSIEQIILKCTEKSADRRYQNAPELVEDLKKSLIDPEGEFVNRDVEEPGGVTKKISEGDLELIKQKSRESIDEKYNTGNLSKLENNNNVEDEYVEDPYDESYGGPYVNDDYEGDTDGYDPEEYEDDGYIEEEYVKTVKSKSSKSSDKPKSKESGNKKSSDKTGSGKNSDKPKSKENGNGKRPSDRPVNSSGKKKKRRKVEDDYDPKMELITNILIVVAAVVIGLIFLYVIAKFIGFDLLSPQSSTNPGATSAVVQEATMPTVIGQDINAVSEKLITAGFVPSVEYEESETVPAGQVISSSLDAGTTVAAGSAVLLTVSSGVDGVLVPTVEGLSRAEATAKLEKEGFKVNVTKATSDVVEKDIVISQNPAANSRMSRGGIVDVVVSSGVETVPVEVPSILNMDEETANQTLEEKGLIGVMTVDEYSDTVEAGKITYQNYQAGLTVNTGTEIEYRISKGVEPAYYNCQTQIPAPSDYAGGDATVILYGNDGSQLFSTVTASFPVEITVSNIWLVNSGSVSITYNINQQQEVTDADGNVTVQTVQSQKTSEPIPVNFTKVAQ